MRSFGKPLMQRTKLAGFGLLALATSAFAGSAAHAGEDCGWYALTSAKQQQANEQKSCGFAGDGWTTDQNVHKAWCESVSPDEWRNAVTERENQLKGCG
jgi:hypothetical protein